MDEGVRAGDETKTRRDALLVTRRRWIICTSFVFQTPHSIGVSLQFIVADSWTRLSYRVISYNDYESNEPVMKMMNE